MLDANFEPLADRAQALRQAVEVIVQRADRRNVRIVSWSRHDLRIVRTLRDDDPELVARFERRYADARAVAKRWANSLHRSAKPADGRLTEYLAFVGYEAPSDASVGAVGETIRRLRPRLQGGRPLTRNQEQRWTRLLTHNRHDCAGMRAVCLRATRELDAAGSRRLSSVV